MNNNADKELLDKTFDLVLKGLESGHAPVLMDAFKDAVLDVREAMCASDDDAFLIFGILVDMIEAHMYASGHVTFTEQAELLDVMKAGADGVS